MFTWYNSTALLALPLRSLQHSNHCPRCHIPFIPDSHCHIPFIADSNRHLLFIPDSHCQIPFIPDSHRHLRFLPNSRHHFLFITDSHRRFLFIMNLYRNILFLSDLLSHLHFIKDSQRDMARFFSPSTWLTNPIPISMHLLPNNLSPVFADVLRLSGLTLMEIE